MFGRVYPILDLGASEELPVSYASVLLQSPKVKLLQLRAKKHTPAEFAVQASALVKLRDKLGSRAKIIINDNIETCLHCGADGVHLGQSDQAPELARKELGDEYIIGLSTHSLDQLRNANQQVLDYLALGPIFSTQSKENPDPVVGVETYLKAAAETALPLVAIGGITAENSAFAQTAAVISDLRNAPDTSKRLADYQ